MLVAVTLVTITHPRAYAQSNRDEPGELSDAPSKQLCLQAYADAQERRLEGSLLAAREHLIVCSHSACPGPVLKDCAGWLSEVDHSLSSVVFAVSDAQGRDVSDASVTSKARVVSERTDGHAVLLDPGAYTFVIEAPGYERTEQSVTLREGEKQRLLHVLLSRIAVPEAIEVAPEVKPGQTDAAPAPEAALSVETGPARADQQRWPVITTVLGGVALAGVGSFAYFGLHGKGVRDDADARCPQGPTDNCDSLLQTGKRDYLVANISLGVSVAAAVSAALVYWLVESKPSAQETARSSRRQPARVMPVVF